MMRGMRRVTRRVHSARLPRPRIRLAAMAAADGPWKCAHSLYEHCVTCCQTTIMFYNGGKALGVRILLSAGIALCTLRAASINEVTNVADVHSIMETAQDANKWIYWLPLLGILLYIPEFLVTVKMNKGHDFKWWSPSFAIFILSVLPCVWLIEIDMWERRREAMLANNLTLLLVPEAFGSFGPYQLDYIMLTANEWTRILEQVTFLVIIFAKWLSPKGTMSREGLSMLLLVYIAIATDVLDIVDTFKEPRLADKYGIVIVVMIAYSLAHVQFTINYAARAKSNKPITTSRVNDIYQDVKGACCATELWAMLCTIMFQDGPFFALRLYFIFGYQVISYSNIFFTCKNGIVLCMDLYRIGSIACEAFDDEEEGIGGTLHRKSLAVFDSMKEDPEAVALVCSVKRDHIHPAHLEPEDIWELVDKDVEVNELTNEKTIRVVIRKIAEAAAKGNKKSKLKVTPAQRDSKVDIENPPMALEDRSLSDLEGDVEESFAPRK